MSESWELVKLPFLLIVTGCYMENVSNYKLMQTIMQSI